MEVKDQATAVEAALNLNKGSEPVEKPGEPKPSRKKSTSQVLFPENITEDGGIVNRPIRPYEDAAKEIPKGSATPTPQPASSAPSATAPTEPSYLDLSKLPENTMVRMKVDGVEMDVPAKEALKNFQLERHLTLKAQQLAEREKAFEAERLNYRQQMTEPPQKQPSPKKQEVIEPTAPESAEVLALRAELAALRQTLAPQMFDASLKKLEARVKENLGADDFLTYVPKIKEFVDSELKKPEISGNPQAVSILDSQDFWYGKYQEIKLKEMISGAKQSTPTPSVVAQPQIIQNPVSYPNNTVAVIDKSGEVRPMPVVEGSGGVPTRIAPDADWQARYREAFARAQKEPTNANWAEVFRLKREAPAQ